MGKYFIVGISWYIRIMIVALDATKSSEWVCDGIQWNFTNSWVDRQWVCLKIGYPLRRQKHGIEWEYVTFFKLLHRMRYPLFRHPFVFSRIIYWCTTSITKNAKQSKKIMGSRSSGKFDTLKPTNKLRPKNDESYWNWLGYFSFSRSWCMSRRDVSLSWNTHTHTHGASDQCKMDDVCKTISVYIHILYECVTHIYIYICIHASLYIHRHIVIDKCKFITTSACGFSGAGAEGETLQDRAGGSRSSGSKSLIRYDQDEDEDQYHEYHWHNWYRYPLVI